MNQPKDLLSIFRNKGSNRHHLFDGSSSSALKQWSFILVFGILAVATAAGYAFERFNYWGSIEGRIAEEDLIMSNYDQTAFRAILAEFESREQRSQSIIEKLKTTTATEETVEGEGDIVTDSDISTSTPEELE
ncbi:MAG: hypothetical protein WD605_00700 [Candidatus Paceibacterota bacterium]